MKKTHIGLVVVWLATAAFAQGVFEGRWESLSAQEVPEWMKDAKFGVYTHWSVFSVPAKGGPDYIKNLYSGPDKDVKGIYSHHVEKYGTLDQFGYKDFVPLFTAENFNADEWVGLMHEAGAKFGASCWCTTTASAYGIPSSPHGTPWTRGRSATSTVRSPRQLENMTT